MRLLAEVVVVCTLLSVTSAQKYPYGEVSLIVKLWSDPPILQKTYLIHQTIAKGDWKVALVLWGRALWAASKGQQVFCWMCLLYFKTPLSEQMMCLSYLQGTMARRQWNEWWRKYSLLSFSCNACKLRLKSSKSSLAWWIPSGTRGLPRRRGPRKVWISYGFNDGQSS